MPYALLIDNHDKANPRPWVAAGADAESVIERIAPDISRKRAKAFHLIGFFKNAKRARKAGVGKFRERGFTVGNWYPTFPDIWTADIEEVRQ